MRNIDLNTKDTSTGMADLAVATAFPTLPFRRRRANYPHIQETPIQNPNAAAYRGLQLLRELLVGEQAYREAVAFIDEMLEQGLSEEDEAVLQKYYWLAWDLFESGIEN